MRVTVVKPNLQVIQSEIMPTEIWPKFWGPKKDVSIRKDDVSHVNDLSMYFNSKERNLNKSLLNSKVLFRNLIKILHVLLYVQSRTNKEKGRTVYGKHGDLKYTKEIFYGTERTVYSRTQTTKDVHLTGRDKEPDGFGKGILSRVSREYTLERQRNSRRSRWSDKSFEK